MPVSTPIITSNGGAATASISIREGTTAVTTIQGLDPDGDSLVYSIVGGADRFLFKIDALTGVLSFRSPPDVTKPTDFGANNVYDVIVQVADGPRGMTTTLKATQAIAVTVTSIPPVTLNGTSGADILGPTGTTVRGDTLNGLGGNDMLDGGQGADIMSGGLGDDIFIVRDAGDQCVENAGEGTDTVRSTISHALAANVENLVLVGVADINATGNAQNNALTGNAGANVIVGGEGADTMTGGAGNDTYSVDNAGDVIVELDVGGIDQVQSSISYVLSNGVENLTLTGFDAISGTGNGLDNILVGNGVSNTLNGGLGNDTLDGGEGADTMTGGLGDDTYVVENAGDVITEAQFEGTDTVRSSSTFVLGANVENLVLTGFAAINGTGNAQDNRLTGNSAANTLVAGAGNDVIDGAGGIDRMFGGIGDDTYLVDNSADAITESAGQGTDVVFASASYILSANVENLTLTGSAASGTGNELDNLLTGNTSANTLVGGAGNDRLDGMLGGDTLVGGAGNDTYVVDAGGDTITELAGEGIDQVLASVTYGLADNVENLAFSGSGAFNGYGNALDNVLTGNIGANTLDAGAGHDTIDGGRGSDKMYGGTGNDYYIVADSGDLVFENAGEGTDAVLSFISSYTLAANVENLTLGGSSTINGTGNGLSNAITGNGNGNILDGGDGNDAINGGFGLDTIIGGLGQDTMTGGADADRFAFRSILESSKLASTSDLITDFSKGDLIDLSAIDARTDQVGDQGFALDTNGVLAAGEILQSRSGNIITVSILTNPAVAGADMLFRVQVDATIAGLLTAENFIF